MERYTIKQFNLEYPDEQACLDAVFQNRYGDLEYCPSCGAKTKFYKLANRKAYSCKECRHQLHPLAGTIFHKSETPLKSWFFAIYLFSTSKNGVSAKELERHLGVTYKTAWRIAFKIRTLMTDNADKLDGTVEIDETFIGSRKKGTDVPVLGMVERGGKAKAKVIAKRNTDSIVPPVREHVARSAEVMTDEFFAYAPLKHLGYLHRTVKHKETYVVGDIYTNTIEGFWSQLKRSISGTYHVVSPKYLQNYVDEFAFRYSLRTVCVYPELIARAGRRV